MMVFLNIFLVTDIFSCLYFILFIAFTSLKIIMQRTINKKKLICSHYTFAFDIGKNVCITMSLQGLKIFVIIFRNKLFVEVRFYLFQLLKKVNLYIPLTLSSCIKEFITQFLALRDYLFYLKFTYLLLIY